MTSNNELVEVAHALGVDVFVSHDIVWICKSYVDTRRFNPTEGELTVWLLERGEFISLCKTSANYYLGELECGNNFIAEGNLKENLPNICLQVIRNKEDDNDN